MLRWLRPDRHVVTSLCVSLDARELGSALQALHASQRRMVETEGDFEVAREEVARAVTQLLEHRAAWDAAALSADVVNGEEAAGDAGARAFADLAARYADLPSVEAPRRAVVAVTTAYRGEDPELEAPVHDAQGLERALTALLALGHRDAAGLWHLHVVPVDDADDDVLLARFPELVNL